MRRTGLIAWLGALLALLAGTAALAQDAPPRRKVIIDDDGFGLMQMMLLQSPDVEVLAVTTVSGNVWANRATAFALRGLEAMGRTDVPVAQGATYPLVNSEAATERWEALYGKLVWKGAWQKQWVEPVQQQAAPDYHGPDDAVLLDWGQPTTKPADEIAANLLIRLVHKYPGEVTIIATGPLTNLALAQRLDPQFAALAKELVMMGGSFNPRQRLDNPAAAEFARDYANSPRREFNIRFDPEAASIVERAPWKKIIIVPADPATATQLTPELAQQLFKDAAPGAQQLIAHADMGFPLWDEIAAAAWLDPNLVGEWDTLYVDANTIFGPGYGDTLSWREGYQPGLGEQKAQVIRTVDVGKMEALMVRLMGNRPAVPLPVLPAP